MYNLLRYLVRNGAFLLFILCEIIAFYLVIQYNQGQKKIFQYSSQKVAASIYNQYDHLVRYFDLTSVSDSLAWENARLKSSLYNLQLASDRPGKNRNEYDSAITFSLHPAKVISNGVVNRNNMITLRMDNKAGIKTGMGILGQRGPVGIITGTSNNYATAISILHSQSSISARLKGGNYFGTLTWESANPQIMKLNAIPKHAPISIGDTVETSGYSFTFPEGILIGTVKSYRLPEGSNFYEIEISLSYDVSNIDYVYIIMNNQKALLDSMQRSKQ